MTWMISDSLKNCLYSTYIAYLFMSSPTDSLYTLYINYLHLHSKGTHCANVELHVWLVS